MVTQKKKSSPSAIQSIERAIAILQSFTKTDSELGVTALSEQLGLHKSTVSRLLATLQHGGIVEQNPDTGRFRLGLGLVTLAGIVLERIDVQQVAHSFLSTLAELTQETVNIVVLDGSECMNIGGATSPRPIQYVGRIGRRTPAHCTSAGKILLAYLTPEERREILPGKLTRFTDKTIVDRKALEKALAHIREQGFAVTHQEHQEGLSAVAAPIFDHTGRVTAAVTVSGPTYRIGPGEIEAFVEVVRKTARDISAQLGYITELDVTKLKV